MHRIEALPIELRRWLTVVGDCWLWNGRLRDGYGRVRWNGIRYQAHRLIYEQLVGPIPDGLELDHVKARGCTSRACCNPDHLEPVTHAENIARGNVGSNNRDKTHCAHGHAFDEANTRIRMRDGTQRRECRACARDRRKAG